MEQLESMFEVDPTLKSEHQNSEEVDGERALIVDLIETVKAHPSLYDRQTGNFQDGRNRQFLWQSVGDEMKEKGHIIKGTEGGKQVCHVTSEICWSLYYEVGMTGTESGLVIVTDIYVLLYVKFYPGIEKLLKRFGLKWTGSSCREKWNSLKRRYIRELSAITSSAEYSPRVSKWPYFNVFDFLQPYVQQNLPPVIKNESPIVDAENEAGTSAEQAFDENLGKILGLETGEPKRKRIRLSKVHKDLDDRLDDTVEETKFKNRSVMVKLWDMRNEAFVASLCGLTTFLDDEQLAAFQKDTLCDLARRLLSPPNKTRVGHPL
ncbi:unnamed protein product [Enterobius vermicularis]|uniref:MADF domain-containing protein n=1 Tax=Enterobius vermicularis TaxID=51028 RepID=A0A0N4V3N3_ENTVE|nr:unnamed protein product [Enterobius vermicularis]